MVKLLVGHKGSGKTKSMVDLANDSIANANGSIIFINRDARLMYDLKYQIRSVCMTDYEGITNCDELVGFVYGIISSDHDIEKIFIDSVLKLGDVKLSDMPEFIERLKKISDHYGPEFIVSLSANPEELIGVNFDGTEILN